MDKLPLHRQLWGEYAGHIREKDSLKIYEKLLEMKDKILIILDGIGNLFVQLIEDNYFLFLDELQLSNELAEASNNAFARPSKDVSKGAMYFGILTNRILPVIFCIHVGYQVQSQVSRPPLSLAGPPYDGCYRPGR